MLMINLSLIIAAIWVIVESLITYNRVWHNKEKFGPLAIPILKTNSILTLVMIMYSIAELRWAVAEYNKDPIELDSFIWFIVEGSILSILASQCRILRRISESTLEVL